MRIRIALPLYRKLPREYSWTQAPLSADAPPESDQETIRRHWLDVPWGVDANFYDGWQQSPLAADNEESAKRTVTSNPEVRYARPLPDQTWLQAPLADSIEDPLLGTESRLSELAPWGRDKNLYDGWQAAPLSDDFTEEAASRYVFDLTPWSRDRNSYEGWVQSPLPDDNEESSSRIETPFFNWALDPNDYGGWLSQPLSEDSTEEAATRTVWDLTPWGRDRNLYDGWAQVPLADDNEEASTRIATENPETRFARPLPDQTWAQSPLADDVVDPQWGIETRLTDVAPWAKDRSLYDGFQAAPLSTDFAEPEIQPAVTDLPPWTRDRNLYDGWQSAPLAADEDILPQQASSTDLPPWVRDRNLYDGFQGAPLTADSGDEPVAQRATDLAPWGRDRISYEGFQAAPLSTDAGVEEPLFGATDLALNLHWTQPDLGYMGHASGPTSDNVVAPETAIYRPTFRHRRR